MMSTPTITPTASEQTVQPAPHGRRRWRLLLILALVVAAATGAVVLFIVSGSEDPPILSNGDFETGDLTGWSTESWGNGEWLVYEDGTTPPEPWASDHPSSTFNLPDPPQGLYAAATVHTYSGARFLYRDIEVTGPWVLHATVFYESPSLQIFDQPDFGTFSGTTWDTRFANQQFRIDLIDPEAEIHSVAANDVYATVFGTQAGDPISVGPTPVAIDLSPWEGQTIRLRVAQVDNAGALYPGIDNVRLERAD
ncbi:MAG: hypothetical protein HKN80_06945 [Acidimicrobiia bacterium]|nr:hypothetical protein [Acidimicrobiia bacterium]